MLANVKFFKKIIFILVCLLFNLNLYADKKDEIISQLNDLKSLEFTFDQIINEKTEK